MNEIKTVECLEFEYKCFAEESKLMVESELQLTAQTPKDETLLERAILVRFEVKETDDKFKLKCVCRVIFTFEKSEKIIEGKELLQMCQEVAYKKMQEIVRNTLKLFGQNEEIFPDIKFD